MRKTSSIIFPENRFGEAHGNIATELGKIQYHRGGQQFHCDFSPRHQRNRVSLPYTRAGTSHGG